MFKTSSFIRIVEFSHLACLGRRTGSRWHGFRDRKAHVHQRTSRGWYGYGDRPGPPVDRRPVESGGGLRPATDVDWRRPAAPSLPHLYPTPHRLCAAKSMGSDRSARPPTAGCCSVRAGRGHADYGSRLCVPSAGRSRWPWTSFVLFSIAFAKLRSMFNSL